MNIPQNIKELYQADSVPKNLRIHFPNGERQDITNENIIGESVSLTESLCSQKELKFGLCEAAVFEAELFEQYDLEERYKNVKDVTGAFINASDSVEGKILEVSISGKSELFTTTGKNLFDGIMEQGSRDKATGVKVASSTQIRSVNPVSVTEGMTYCFSFLPTTMTVGAHLFKDGIYVKSLTNEETKKFTVTSDFNQVYFQFYKEGSLIPSQVTNMQFELNTVVTPYEPYTGRRPAPSPSYPQEIKSVGDSGSIVVESRNINIIDDGFVNCTNEGITLSRDNEGNIIASGKSTSGSKASYFAFNIKLKPGTYYFACPEIDVNGVTARYVETVNPQRNLGYSNKNNGMVCVSEENSKLDMKFVFAVWAGKTVVNHKIIPQLSVTPETTFTKSEISQITIPLSEPLRSLGDVKDEICKRNGVYGILRRVKKTIIDNNSDLRGMSVYYPLQPGTPTSSSYVCLTLLDRKFDSVLGMCNRLPNVSYMGNLKAGIRFDIGNRVVELSNGFSLLWEDMRSWLESNPLEILYELEIPTFTEFSDQKIFDGFKSFDKITNFFSTDILSPRVSVTYESIGTAIGSRQIENVYPTISDLKGLDIEVTQEIGGYSLPYGKFKIDSCKKQSNMSKRRMIAYDALKSDRLDKSALSAFNDFMTKYSTPYLSTDFISGINYMANRMGVKLEYPHEVMDNTLSDIPETQSVTYLNTTTHSLMVDYKVYPFQNIAELAHAYLGFDLPLSIVSDSKKSLKLEVRQEVNPFISEADMIKHLIDKQVIILCDSTVIPISDIASVITHGASSYKIGFATQAYVRDAKTTRNYFTHMLFYDELSPVPITELQKLIKPIRKISELYFFTIMQPKQIAEEFTYRTFFQSVFEIMGAFGRIDRNGEFRMFDIGAVIGREFVNRGIQPLPEPRIEFAATVVDDYALFGGGYGTRKTDKVDVYNKNLVKSLAKPLSQERWKLEATTIGDYALFAGGETTSSKSAVVNAYSKTLTMTTRTALSQARSDLEATTIGDYALFAGGETTSSKSAVVNAYSKTLTMTTRTALSQARSRLAATSIGDYAIFSGGYDFNVVDAYNKSLVRISAPSLPRRCMAATSVGDYALFGSDNLGSLPQHMSAYNKQLVRSTSGTLPDIPFFTTATSVGGYAIFSGSSNDYWYGKPIVNVYNKSLVKSNNPRIPRVSSYKAVAIGEYALFAMHAHDIGLCESVEALKLEITSTSIKETTISEAIQKGDIWYDDYIIKEFGKIQIVSKNNLAYEYIGRAEAENVYVIKDNWLIENFDLSENYQDIAKNLYDKIGYTTYVPVNAEIKGLPYLEVGDRICLKSRNGDVHTLILSRNLKGVQALIDNYEANGNEVNEEFKEA